mgnify:CR=1 FL=1
MPSRLTWKRLSMLPLVCGALLGSVACIASQGPPSSATAAADPAPGPIATRAPTLAPTVALSPTATSTVTASATVTMSPTATVPPTATPAGGIAIKSAFGAHPGGIGQVVVQTSPGANCNIEHVLPSGRVNSGRGLTPSRASGSGLVLWNFAIPADTLPGMGRIVVVCNGASVSRELLTQP